MRWAEEESLEVSSTARTRPLEVDGSMARVRPLDLEKEGRSRRADLLDVLDDGDLELGVEAVLCEELLKVVALVL